MKKFMKKSITVLLVCALFFSAVTCFAAGEKKYYDYGTYVVLGDSVASGHNDLVYVDSEFKRVDDSYGAYVADELGVEYIPMACPGTRTIDMRYMLEDDYPADDYLFHDAHDVEVMKARIPEYRKAISEAGLITLGIGGNDFGTFLTWVIADELEKQNTCDEYVKALKELLQQGGADDDDATFDYWVNMNTQEKIAQNPLEVKNIQECAVYEAHFKSDKAITMEFPEEGGYKIVYFDKGYLMPATNVVDNTFDFWGINISNNLNVTEDSSAYYIQPGELSNYLYPGNPHILYGKGLMTFVEDDEMQKSSSNELEWSGDNGVNVADLSLDKKYYSVNLEKKQFELLADDAVIAPKTAYFAMPVECYTAHKVEKAPSIVYWYKPETSTGIEEIKPETVTVGNAKGIYSIDGKKLNAIPAKGLYIVNGKKVIKLK